MARRYKRDARGRFSSTGGGGGRSALRRERNYATVSRMRSARGDNAFGSFDTKMSLAKTTAKGVQVAGPKGGAAAGQGRGTAAQMYSRSVPLRGEMARNKRREGEAGSAYRASLRSQIKTYAAAAQRGAEKAAAQSPGSKQAKEARSLARMTQALAGTHPKQRIRRKR